MNILDASIEGTQRLIMQKETHFKNRFVLAQIMILGLRMMKGEKMPHRMKMRRIGLLSMKKT